MSSVKLGFGLAGVLLAAGAWAAPVDLVDATSYGAVGDGTLGAAEYAGASAGIHSGFGDVIGAGSSLHVDADVNGRLGFGFQLGAGTWNDDIVIYIDSKAGGIADTAAFTDTGDGLRKAISGTDGSNRATLTFAPGFAADYALALNNGFAGLWQLAANGSHVFLGTAFLANSGGTPEVGIALDDIGLDTDGGGTLRYVATLISETAYRSDEYHGVADQAFTQGWTAHVLAAGDFNTFRLTGSTDDTDANSDLLLTADGTNAYLMTYGDDDDDWYFQSTTNLAGPWSTISNLGPTLAHGTTNQFGTHPPVRRLAATNAAQIWYRGLRTAGLYDPELLRTIRLGFSGNWTSALAAAKASETYVAGTLALDNGVTNLPIGARYRGNSSYSMGGAKKSFALTTEYTNSVGTLMGFDNLNLNNAYSDNTLMHETLYFNVMRHYAVCPHAALAQVFVNGTNWGVYSFAQQQDGDLIKEWFPSNDGDRWRAPNMVGGGGGGGGSDGGGALSWLGSSLASYTNMYELKASSTNSATAYQRLTNAIYLLNFTATNGLRDSIENVMGVDRWLWFLACENVFADDDSYFNKGADYMMYFEPETGRLYPVEHDGNESFYTTDVALSPVDGATNTNRPVLLKFLGNPELRQRYLAHMRTILQNRYNPAYLNAKIEEYRQLGVAAITADPKKSFTMATYSNALASMRTYVGTRYTNLMNHAELTPLPPVIAAVYAPTATATAAQAPVIRAHVFGNGTNGIHSVWLYHRGKSYGRFWSVQMLDDGAHGDGAAGDGLFGATPSNYTAGTSVRYYVEARSANAARAAAFAPPRAEENTYSYRIGLTTASHTPVVLNELMASNSGTLADPQGEYDDWIELANWTDQPVSLTGRYLTDDPAAPRKWQFPTGTVVAANGYLLVWADEDGSTNAGLHASFKLSASGEELYLVDGATNGYQVLDQVVFGAQTTDLSFGRTAADLDVWTNQTPTPGAANP